MTYVPRFAALLAIAALLSASALPAHAATDPSTIVTAHDVQAGGDPLRDFGGEKGLEKLVEDFLAIVYKDKRIGSFFEKADKDRLNFLIFHQFCQYLGGKCIYKGKSMKEAHKTMGVKTMEFNAMCEDLEVAMRARKIPFGAQMKLLGKLAPLKRDIVTK